VLKKSKIVPLPTASPDELCCICLHLYGPSHKAVTVLIKDCYHRFGEGCLDEYLNSDSPRNNTCPQCRREWYKRQSSWTAPRDTNTTHALTPFSQLRAHVRTEPRTRAHRTQRILEQDQTTNNSIISTHLDEVFRRLDLIQDMNNQQITSTADTRVRLQAVERRARRINQDLQTRSENTTVQALPSIALRGNESRRRVGSHGYGRWIDAFMTEVEDDPYSLHILRDGTNVARDITVIGELPPQRRQATSTIAESRNSRPNGFSSSSRLANIPPQPPPVPGYNPNYLSRGDVVGAIDLSPVLRVRNTSSRSTSPSPRSVFDMHIRDTTTNTRPTLRARTPNSSWGFMSTQTSDHTSPARVADIPNRPPSRSNRGNSMETPTLRPSPSTHGRASTSIMERGRYSSRDTMQSRENHRWLPLLRRHFSMASLRDAVIP
jgi:hypothetical protein